MSGTEVAELQAPTVVQALARVMGHVQAVRKDGHNSAQNFNFRGIDAVVNAVGPALRQEGVIVLPEVIDAEYGEVEVGKNRSRMQECRLRMRFTFHGPAGDTLTCSAVGVAMDSGDKAAPKAHSVAFRTALLQALCIPTDEPDPDATTYQRSDSVPMPSAERLSWDALDEDFARMPDDKRTALLEVADKAGGRTHHKPSDGIDVDGAYEWWRKWVDKGLTEQPQASPAPSTGDDGEEVPVTKPSPAGTSEPPAEHTVDAQEVAMGWGLATEHLKGVRGVSKMRDDLRHAVAAWVTSDPDRWHTADLKPEELTACYDLAGELAEGRASVDWSQWPGVIAWSQDGETVELAVPTEGES